MSDDFETVRDGLGMLWGFNKKRRVHADSALDRIEARLREAEKQARIQVETLTSALDLAQARLREAEEQEEDWRRQFAEQAFTAPDADWGTIYDSYKARHDDALARVAELEQENERLRKEHDLLMAGKPKHIAELYREVERLRADLAGDRDTQKSLRQKQVEIERLRAELAECKEARDYFEDTTARFRP